MSEIAIKKGSGIEGLVSGHKTQEPEETKKLDADDRFKTLYSIFEEFAPAYYNYSDNPPKKFSDYDGDYLMKADLMPRMAGIVLTSREITHFFQSLERYTDELCFIPVAEDMTNLLIQNSYNAGHNNFFIDLSYLNQFFKVANDLGGREENNLKIKIYHDKIYTAGRNCKNCTFEFVGDAEIDRFSGRSENCTYIFGKEASLNFSNRRGARSAFNCTFKTDSKSKAELLRDAVRFEYKGRRCNNKIIYINNGEEEIYAES